MKQIFMKHELNLLTALNLKYSNNYSSYESPAVTIKFHLVKLMCLPCKSVSSLTSNWTGSLGLSKTCDTRGKQENLTTYLSVNRK